MVSWPILILLFQSALLGTGVWYFCVVVKRVTNSNVKVDADASKPPTDFREIHGLLSMLSRVIVEHNGELSRFEQSLQSPPLSSSPDRGGLDSQLEQIHLSNRKVEGTIDNTVAALMAACGELLGKEQSCFTAYRDQTQAFDKMLSGVNRETLLAALTTRLVDMIRELQAENATVRSEVAAAKDRTIELMSRAHSAEQTARTDALTQLPNRRCFEETHLEFHDKFERTDEPYAVVLLDLDHFKSINDRHGHSVGDAVLAMVGRIFLENRRLTDLLCRMGGEEFALLLPKCDMGVASLVADRYRQRIEAAVLRANDEQVSVTVSCGVAVSRPNEPKGRLLERADRALYAAKSQGRNRVCIDQLGDDGLCVALDKESPTRVPGMIPTLGAGLFKTGSTAPVEA